MILRPQRMPQPVVILELKCFARDHPEVRDEGWGSSCWPPTGPAPSQRKVILPSTWRSSQGWYFSSYKFHKFHLKIFGPVSCLKEMYENTRCGLLQYTLGLCNCDWRICISRIFSPGKIWQIFEPYSLIDFLLYNLRIPTNKRNILLRVL